MFDDVFSDPEPETEVDPLDDLFELTPEQPKQGRAGTKQMNVTIAYDAPPDNQVGQLIMECIASRGIISSDYHADKAKAIYQNLGKLEARTLARDEDRWQMFVFATEWLRTNDPTAWGESIRNIGKVNPDWDETQENVQQDGRTLGGVDDDPLAPPLTVKKKNEPVREQIENAKKANIEKNRPNAAPADLDKIKAEANDPKMQIWVIAQELAMKPRDEWEHKVDWMLEQKIKYCVHWLQHVKDSNAPFPEDARAIFWPHPMTDPREKPNFDRRNAITGKVLKFWRKSVLENGEGIDLQSKSYRVTLAAIKLHKAIDEYVRAGAKFNLEGEVQDKAEEVQVQRAAKEYFRAHFPVTAFGAKPGPISTLDPDYVEYVRLCRTYKLEIGTLLHETEL